MKVFKIKLGENIKKSLPSFFKTPEEGRQCICILAACVIEGTKAMKRVVRYKLELATDLNLNLIALQGKLEECSSEIRLCIEDCKTYFPLFDVIEFHHIRKIEKKAAHTLARHGVNYQEVINWTGKLPPWLHKIVPDKVLPK